MPQVVAEEWRFRFYKKEDYLDCTPLPTRPISLDLREVELPEEAVDAGLLEASFFSRRVLSIPFSRGE